MTMRAVSGGPYIVALTVSERGAPAMYDGGAQTLNSKP